MKTIFILCDALKSLYLTQDNMPFLYSLSGKGYYIKNIIPCAGFCERSEIFSGLDAYDTGNFTAIGYLPENSPYENNTFILQLFEWIKKVDERIYNRLFRYWRTHNHKVLGGYRIPPKSLSKFALTEDGDKQLVPHKEIFQELESKGLTYTLEGFTSLSDIGRRTKFSVKELAEREINRGTDFIPLYVGETDCIGHRYGGDIENIKPTLKATDLLLEEIYNLASKAEYCFCVMGDHGMVPVTEKVDVIEIVKQSGCKLHKDYEAFYDSTMARYWFYNKEAKDNIRSVLENRLPAKGIIVDKNNSAEYRIPLDILSEQGKPVYGDLIWCANPGVLISPDYFHSERESENGMHGYVEVVEGHGTGLFVEMYDGINHQVIDKAHSSQICGELCKSLGIDQPNSKEWKRLV